MGKIKILGEEIEYSDDLMPMSGIIDKYNSYGAYWYLKSVEYLGNMKTNKNFLYLIAGLHRAMITIIENAYEYIEDDTDVEMFAKEVKKAFHLSNLRIPLTDLFMPFYRYLKSLIERIDKLMFDNREYYMIPEVYKMSESEWDNKTFGAYNFHYKNKSEENDIPDYIEKTIRYICSLSYVDDILNEDFPMKADAIVLLAEITKHMRDAFCASELSAIEHMRGYEFASFYPSQSVEITEKIKNANTADDETKKQLIEAIRLYPRNKEAYKLIIHLFGDKDREVDAAVRLLEIKELYEKKKDENFPHRKEFTYKEGLLYEIVEKSDFNTYEEMRQAECDVKEKSEFYGVGIPGTISYIFKEARAILAKQAEKEHRNFEEEERKYKEREEQERLKREEDKKRRERELQEQKLVSEKSNKTKPAVTVRLTKGTEVNPEEEERKRREREEQERLRREEEERKQKEREEQERLRREEERKRKEREEEERKQKEREEQERIRREEEKKRKEREEQERLRREEEERKHKEREEQERIRREEERKRKECEEQERLRQEEQKRREQMRTQQEEEKRRKWEALPITNKSKSTALILSIIFGWLGIDRFYLGHIITGIIKLITGGGFGIWWIIDIILIATDILQPKAGRYKIN